MHAGLDTSSASGLQQLTQKHGVEKARDHTPQTIWDGWNFEAEICFKNGMVDAG